MAHKLEWEPKGVYWKYSGQVTGKEVIQASTAIYGDPRFDDLRYTLIDFLGVDAMEMTVNDVNIITSQHNAAAISNPHVKNAIVTQTNSILDLAKKFADNLRESSWEVQLFDNLNEANHWLNRLQPI